MACFLDLPFEVLTRIAEYLKHSDRAALKESCRTLYEVCTQPLFSRKLTLTIEETTVLQEHDPLLKVYMYIPQVTRIVLQKVDIHYNSPFWLDHGNNIKHLIINQCELDSDSLLYILSNCLQLISLRLENLSQLFMMFRQSVLVVELPHLESLELCSSRYVTDRIFNCITKTCPNISHLSICGCENFCHPGIYHRFYPNQNLEQPSDAIFSFLYIHNFIQLNADQITSLDFSNTMINVRYLELILKTKGLILTSLNISDCAQLRIRNFKAIADMQPKLKYLSMKNVVGRSMEILSSPLSELVSLEIDGSQNSINAADIMGNLNKLEDLSLANCDPSVINSLIQVLKLNSEPKLRKLSVESVNITRETATVIAKTFKKLTSLNLSYVRVAVDDNLLRTIFENLTLLQEIFLTNCEAITDSGLMGIDSLSTLVQRPKALSPVRIPLGSKVETELREDLARKKEIMKIMDGSLEPIGASIMQLSGLKVLSLKSCFRISDLSLKSVFRFRDLISLDISECQQITYEGIVSVIPNIPSLERLDLSSCYNIDDNVIDVICKGLKRLKWLSLQLANLHLFISNWRSISRQELLFQLIEELAIANQELHPEENDNMQGTSRDLKDCRQLTDKSLLSVRYSKSLRYLNVRGCERMHQDMIAHTEEVLEHKRVY